MDRITPTSQESAVSVADLWKRYDAVEAVRGICFEVNTGEIFGLLGPNGAGKTTTLECILGLRQPDRGSIRIAGEDSTRRPAHVKRHVGAQLQSATLQDKITPREVLGLFGSFYAKPYAAPELLRRFNLEEKADSPFASLSSGQRQRLFLALALINRPSLLVLDEPTVGLDPQSRRDLHSMIEEVRTEGRTVLLSTHNLEEAGQLCDRVAVMDEGRIIAAASPKEMITRSRSPVRLIIRTARPLTAAIANEVPGVLRAAPDEHDWVLETNEPNRALAGLLRRLDELGVELLDVEMHRPSLEDVFIELTGRAWSDDDPQGEDE